MNELRLAGGAALCLASCAAGIRAAMSVRRQAEQLAQLRQSFALMRCEIEFGKTPLQELCGRLSETCDGAVGHFYAALRQNLPQTEVNLSEAVHAALRETPALELTQSGTQVLLRLLSDFGRYGSEEQAELLELSCRSLDLEMERLREQLPARVRCRAMLGVGTGLSLFLLVI